MSKSPETRNWVNVENAITVTCTECGASTWKPLETMPPGWSVWEGQIRCNLHGADFEARRA